jgi:hypothetical protein
MGHQRLADLAAQLHDVAGTENDLAEEWNWVAYILDRELWLDSDFTMNSKTATVVADVLRTQVKRDVPVLPARIAAQRDEVAARRQEAQTKLERESAAAARADADRIRKHHLSKRGDQDATSRMASSDRDEFERILENWHEGLGSLPQSEVISHMRGLSAAANGAWPARFTELLAYAKRVAGRSDDSLALARSLSRANEYYCPLPAALATELPAWRDNAEICAAVVGNIRGAATSHHALGSSPNLGEVLIFWAAQAQEEVDGWLGQVLPGGSAEAVDMGLGVKLLGNLTIGSGGTAGYRLDAVDATVGRSRFAAAFESVASHGLMRGGVADARRAFETTAAAVPVEPR